MSLGPRRNWRGVMHDACRDELETRCSPAMLARLRAPQNKPGVELVTSLGYYLDSRWPASSAKPGVKRDFLRVAHESMTQMRLILNIHPDRDAAVALVDMLRAMSRVAADTLR